MSETMSGRFQDGEHVLPLRVYYEDTDAGGIVYYANYLKFAERARTELLRLVGVNQSEMSKEYGLVFAVRDCMADFRRPARLDDMVEVRSRLIEVGAASARADQRITRRGEELASIQARIACIRLDGKPVRMPPPVRAVLTPLCQSDNRI